MASACALAMFQGIIIYISRLSRSAERSKRIFTERAVAANRRFARSAIVPVKNRRCRCRFSLRPFCEKHNAGQTAVCPALRYIKTKLPFSSHRTPHQIKKSAVAMQQRAAVTPVDVPTGWDPQAKQQPTGLIAYAVAGASAPPCSRPTGHPTK